MMRSLATFVKVLHIDTIHFSSVPPLFALFLISLRRSVTSLYFPTQAFSIALNDHHITGIGKRRGA